MCTFYSIRSKINVTTTHIMMYNFNYRDELNIFMSTLNICNILIKNYSQNKLYE
jgi:hypothetical protein